METVALFKRCEAMADEYANDLALAVSTKAALGDALELVGAAEGNAVYVMASGNEGAIPGKNEMARKQAIQRCLTTDPACRTAKNAAKAAELSFFLAEARTKATYQRLQVLLAGLNNLKPQVLLPA